MKTGKYISVISVFYLLIVSSCAKMETRPPHSQEIAVKALSSSPTKAPVNNSPDIKTLGVFANRSADPHETDGKIAWEHSDFWRPDGASGTFYENMNNACFAPLNGSFVGVNPGNLQEHTPYKWPELGSLMFSIYSPHSQHSNNKIKSVRLRNYAAKENQGYMTFNVIQVPGSAVSTVIWNEEEALDLLYADSKNILNNKTISFSSVPVQIQLKHAQSRITFKLTSSDNEYKLKEFIVMGCINNAMFYSGQTPGWMPDFPEARPNNPHDPEHAITVNYELLTSEEKQTGIQLSTTPEEKSFITIPQKLDGKYQDDKYDTKQPIVLKISLENTDGVGKETITIDLYKMTQYWIPGKHYIYNIDFAAHKITFGEPVIENLDKEY